MCVVLVGVQRWCCSQSLCPNAVQCTRFAVSRSRKVKSRSTSFAERGWLAWNLASSGQKVPYCFCSARTCGGSSCVIDRSCPCPLLPELPRRVARRPLSVVGMFESRYPASFWGKGGASRSLRGGSGPAGCTTACAPWVWRSVPWQPTSNALGAFRYSATSPFFPRTPLLHNARIIAADAWNQRRV